MVVDCEAKCQAQPAAINVTHLCSSGVIGTLMNLEAEIRACLIQPILSSSSEICPPVECKYFTYVQLHIENVLMKGT